MLDDIRRTHDSRPTEEERAWLDFDPIDAAARIAAILVLAFAIGGYVSYASEASGPLAVAKAR